MRLAHLAFCVRYALFLNMVSSGLEKLSADSPSVETSSGSTGVMPSTDAQTEEFIKTLAKQNGGTAMEDMGEKSKLYTFNTFNTYDKTY